jgi:uncharacterized protein
MTGSGLHHAFAGIEYFPGQTMLTRDGVKLVADVYQPLGDGPFPVLLMRQPYGRDIASTVVYAHPAWFARHGFIVVIQDVRGRGDSEGEFYPFRNEIDDGYDTVLWAAGLPKSKGRVGMYGFSYQGSTQLLAAIGKPAPLRALAPHMTAFDLYSGWFYRNRILQLSTTLAWANQLLREDARRRASPSLAALDESWLAPGRLSSAFPINEAAPITNFDLPAYARDWLRHPRYDEYWREFDLLHYRVAELGLPMFHLAGWYDLYLRGSIDGYCEVSRQHPHQFLLATPWAHIPWGNQLAGINLGPEAAPRVDDMLVEWFHHWLDHDVPRAEPPLLGARYFVLGENRWRTAPEWPPPRPDLQTWFLRSGERANSRFGDGALDRAQAGGPDDVFNYDPEVPVLAPGGNHGGLTLFGPHDLSTQQQSLNLLVYTSAPLTAPIVVAGAPFCRLHVRSSAPETHFVVRLSRVLPDGRALFLCLGAAEVDVDGGAEIMIELDPIAVRFDTGESIRIDLASSAFPLLVRHPNTHVDPASLRSPGEFRRAIQIVYHDAARPSSLTLPVLPMLP